MSKLDDRLAALAAQARRRGSHAPVTSAVLSDGVAAARKRHATGRDVARALAEGAAKGRKRNH